MDEPSSALVRRHGEVERLGGSAASTARLSFDGESFGWKDLPAKTRRLALRDDPVLAERVVPEDLLRESTSGLVQVHRAWRAHPGALVVAVVLRPVRADGPVLRTCGAWRHVSLHSYEALTTPRRRVGLVVPSVVADGGTGPRPGPPVPERGAAHRAWPYLPAVVRESAEKAVPVPDDWLGDLRQGADGGHPTSQDVAVLRRSATAAAVVVARRRPPEMVGASTAEVAQRLAREPWTVEQLTYELRGPALVERTAPQELPW